MIDLEKLLEDVEMEMERIKGTKFRIELNLETAISLCAMLQLALRHPQVSPAANETVKECRQFVDTMIELIERVSPTLAQFMRMGDQQQ